MSLYSIDDMPDAELVALILGRKTPDQECIEAAGYFVHGDGSEEQDFIDIVRESGPAAIRRATRIKAAVELGRRAEAVRRERLPIMIICPKDVVALMAPRYAKESREVFYCLSLNTKRRLIRLTRVSIGSLNASIVHPREVFKEALEISAAAVVMVHNHPSGDPTPSGADIQLTRRLAKAGDILGIELFDHVVIGGGGVEHASLTDLGLM